MIELKVTKKISTRRQYRLEIDRSFIVNHIKDMGYILPRDAGIYVQVPGGGDYSNAQLDIDKDCPIIVTWATETIEEDTH